MKPQRPELGATLDHLCIRSPSPERLARFYERGYGMTAAPASNGWRCRAPGREVLISEGRPNSVDYFAYAFDDEDALNRYRTQLLRRSVAPGVNPSPRFGDSAFSVTDPDGNVAVFGSRAPAEGEDGALPARLQHIAFRTSRMEDMRAFFQRDLGFVLSDRVEDERGVLRACFLRTNHEHHALALFGSPETRLDHHSYETRDVTGITAWADRMAASRIPMHWGVGRHGPGNDIFFMVTDPDHNLVEISAELESCEANRPAGLWPHEQRTLNLWGTAIMRS